MLIAGASGYLLWTPGLDVQDGRHDRGSNAIWLAHGWLGGDDWHPFPEVHWDEAYFREVARHCDQMAVMMYDAGQRIPKAYRRLMADWTQEVLAWSPATAVLLGAPTYDDSGVEYHHAGVENLPAALLGIHAGLARQPLPACYQGVAIYSEWETTEDEWAHFRRHFLRSPKIGP